jgi:dihydroflavonol-4-reductase
MLDALAAITGQRAPRLCLPWPAAVAIGYADQLVARVRGREPRIPLDGVRMARHRMWVNCTKAEHELGFHAGSVEAALERAVEWYRHEGYVDNDLPPMSRAA